MTRCLNFTLIAILMVLVFVPCVNVVFAETGNLTLQEENQEEVSPRGLFVNLSLSLNGGNGQVYATARNDFELFSSTVRVIVQLYSSDVYEENYQNMTLVSVNSIQDLDKGKTISTYASTNGQQKYWIGRMRYKIDSKNWDERIVGPLLYDANGNYIGLT
ncbi:MAG: hypothetical protein NC485_14610 [Ruminococcus flavefaciens]|nr:hypothetical protein [Ruminococcus flavefaciens]